jgi:hypothetical protein
MPLLRLLPRNIQTTKIMTQYDKAKRAHHLSEIVGVNGGHAALCPPYETFLLSRSISRPMPSMMLRSQIEPGSIWARVG